MATWKSTPIQAKHIAVNKALAAAGWDMPNSRKGIALSLLDGGRTVSFRFDDAWRMAILNGETPPSPEQAITTLDN